MQAFALPCHQVAWNRIQTPQGLGIDCGTYKWVQSQTELEVFVPIPENVKRQEVSLAFGFKPNVQCLKVFQGF